MRDYDQADFDQPPGGTSIAKAEGRRMGVQAPSAQAAMASGFAANTLVPRMMFARQNPRLLDTTVAGNFREVFFDEVLADPTGMVYWKPTSDKNAGNIRPVVKNGKVVQQAHYIGPSAAMCLIAASRYGNLYIGKPEDEVRDDRVTVTVETLDLETNVSRFGSSTTSLVDRNGNRMQPHVIANLINATASKAARNATTAIIGKALFADLVGACLQREYQLAQEALEAERKSGKIGELWAKHVAGWAKIGGITEAELLLACAITRPEEVTSAHLTRLNGLIPTVKEGTPARQALGLEAAPEETPPPDTDVVDDDPT